MIKTLKNISDTDQYVTTINGKEMVKAGATFETNKADELIRNYKALFVVVEENVENTEAEEKEEKIIKPAKKSFKK